MSHTFKGIYCHGGRLMLWRCDGALHPRPRCPRLDRLCGATITAAALSLTWFSMALRFLGLLTTVSCNSAIFFIFPSMSIFCRRPRTWLRRRRTVSSFPWRLASNEALAEWMAVTQFSRSVWLLACEGRKEGGGGEVFRGKADISPHRLNSDVTGDKCARAAEARLSSYSVIHHQEAIGWRAGASLDRYEEN